MPISLRVLFRLYILTPGRRIHALNQIKSLPAAANNKELIAAIDKSVAHDREVLQLESQRQGGTDPTTGRSLDTQIDRALGTIARNLVELSRTSDDQDMAQRAQKLSRKLFPEGLSAHVHLPYVDQLAANSRVITELSLEDNKPFVDKVGLQYWVDRLQDLNTKFQDAIDTTGTIDASAVREAARRAKSCTSAWSARSSPSTISKLAMHFSVRFWPKTKK